MSMFNSIVRASALAVVVAAGTAPAQTVLYSTDFNAPTYTAGVLANPVAVPTPISQDGWLQSSGTTNLITVDAAGAVPLTTTGQDVRRTFTPVVTTSAGDSFFLSADINLSAAQTTGDYFMHIGDGGTSNFYARVYARSAVGGFQLAMGTSSGTSGLVWGSTLPFGAIYRVVARYDVVAGTASPTLGNDTGALYVNPVNAYGIGDTAYVTALTTGIDATTIGGVHLRQGNAANAPTLVIDNVSVAYLPTPGAAALLGLGGLLAAKRRR